MIPIGLVFFTFIFIVTGIASEYYSFLSVIGIIILFLWILLRQCKKIFFDSEKLYIRTIFKNNLVKEVKLNKVIDLSSGIFIVKIKYLDNEGKKRRVFTIPDRKTMDDEMNLSNSYGYKFFYGQPLNKIELLRNIINERQE